LYAAVEFASQSYSAFYGSSWHVPNDHWNGFQIQRNESLANGRNKNAISPQLQKSKGYKNSEENKD